MTNEEELYIVDFEGNLNVANIPPKSTTTSRSTTDLYNEKERARSKTRPRYTPTGM